MAFRVLKVLYAGDFRQLCSRSQNIAVRTNRPKTLLANKLRFQIRVCHKSLKTSESAHLPSAHFKRRIRCSSVDYIVRICK